MYVRHPRFVENWRFMVVVSLSPSLIVKLHHILYIIKTDQSEFVPVTDVLPLI